MDKVNFFDNNAIGKNNSKKLTFLDESQTKITSIKTDVSEHNFNLVITSIEEAIEIVDSCPEIWPETKAFQIKLHSDALKKLIRESAIVPSENQESICGGLKDALNTKL